MSVVRVPPDRLSDDALRGLVDAFVLREGTDYGLHERSLEEKRADIYRQLERGEITIVFDLETEEANLVLTRDLPSE